MKLRYRPMAIMGFSSLSVLFLCVYFDDRFSFASIGTGILLLLLTVFIRKFRERVTPFFIAAALIFSGVSFEVLSDYKISYAESLTDREAFIEATVLDEPEFKRSKYYYVIEMTSIDGVKYNVKLSLSASQYINAEPYDTIKLKVKLYEIGSFSRDIKLYYQSKGIFLGGYIGNYDDYPVEIIKPDKKSIDCRLLEFRKTVENRILDKLPNDYGGVTVGMLTGNKDFISDGLIESIRAAGVAPVFAVSGMHLSVWVMGLYSILELLKVRKRLNSVIGIVFTLFFMGVTGFSPSVCRAGIMLLVILAGNLFGRKADPVNSLGFAALVLGIINPMIVADIGFLLSLSSTFGIVALNPRFSKKLEACLNGGALKSIFKLIAESIFISVCATLTSLGFIIVFIGYISSYSILSNLLITYAASLCMLCGGIVALLYPFGAASDFFAVVTGCLSKYIVKVVTLISDFSFATINTTNEYWTYGVIIFYAIVLSAFIVFKSKTAFKTVCIGLAVTVTVCCTLYHFEYSGYTYFKILNVEDSIAAVIAKDDKNALICSQSVNKYFSSTVSSSLEESGFKNADMMIADVKSGTSSGVLSVIKEISPESLIVPQIDGSLTSILPEDKITKASNAQIKLMKNVDVEFVSNSHFCVAYCNADGVSVCILLRFDEIENVPEEFLDEDILVAAEPYDGFNYESIIVTGEDADSGLVSTEKYGSIDVKIKNGDYKIIVEEG